MRGRQLLRSGFDTGPRRCRSGCGLAPLWLQPSGAQAASRELLVRTRDQNSSVESRALTLDAHTRQAALRDVACALCLSSGRARARLQCLNRVRTAFLLTARLLLARDSRYTLLCTAVAGCWLVNLFQVYCIVRSFTVTHTCLFSNQKQRLLCCGVPFRSSPSS